MKQQASMIISGVVQGVGFRYLARDVAHHYTLKGEVENLDDDTVRIVCEGEESDISRLVDAIRNSKKPIYVDDIQVEYSSYTGKYRGFKIILGDQLAEMAEGFGTGSIYLRTMLDKQDQMLGKQDQMLDKQDQMLGKQDQMLDKQDQMLDKQDVVIGAIRTLSSSIHEMMDERFQRIEDEIMKIKAKLP